jgi:hypothetical protein
MVLQRFKGSEVQRFKGSEVPKGERKNKKSVLSDKTGCVLSSSFVGEARSDRRDLGGLMPGLPPG